jgi:outer membrane immunogenic protein
MRNFLLTTVAMAALAGQAFAADLPSRKEAPVYIAPAPIYNWTGFYIGADLGGSFGNANLWVPGNFGNSFSHNANNDGVIGGGFVGYNYQINSFVLGVQGEFDGLSNSNNRYLSGPLGFIGDRYQSEVSQDWIASIDGRLGYSGPGWDRFLVYAIGGAAWSQLSASLTNTFTGYGHSISNTRSGYDVGGGVEYAFTNNWTGRLEYRYYNFGTNNTAWADGLLNGAYYRTTVTNNVIRVGLAYKFGAPEPVVAKY